MPRAGFEPVIPMFERLKIVLALDCSDIETGKTHQYHLLFYPPNSSFRSIVSFFKEASLNKLIPFGCSSFKDLF
jgi:hypothetical protein